MFLFVALKYVTPSQACNSIDGFPCFGMVRNRCTYSGRTTYSSRENANAGASSPNLKLSFPPWFLTELKQ